MHETGTRRRRERQKTIRSGRIIFGRGFSSMACTILELTKDGAALKPIAGEILPRYFVLGLPDGRRFNCVFVHRTNEIVGVKFES